MKIKEEQIDNLVSKYETEGKRYIDDLAEVIDQYPELAGFLMQESNDILTEEEKDMLWYIVLIIIKSVEDVGVDIAEHLTIDNLSQQEEKNWSNLQEVKSGTFYERISPFYEGYAEEDMLSFVEDTVQIDDDSPITKIGRDVIFISAKSIIDLIR